VLAQTFCGLWGGKVGAVSEVGNNGWEGGKGMDRRKGK